LRLGAVSRVSQPGPDGRHRLVITLPAQLSLSAAQRSGIRDHVAALRRLMEQTPENNESSEKATIVHITKIMLALPSQKASEAAAEARVEAFSVALDTLPCWAVAAAVRGWYCGQYGNEHDYRWQPAPAILRRLAYFEAWKLRRHIGALEDVLDAEPLITFSEEHCAQMRQRLATEIPVVFGHAPERSGAGEPLPESF
jgi:hypothetical protein